MSDTEIEVDESCKHQTGGHLWGPTKYPFYSDRGAKMKEILCLPSDNFTGLIDTRGDESRGVIAMHIGDLGVFGSFTADELRGCAQQLMAMADHMDRGDG